VTLLRCTGRTVEELARALGLTDNGVRSHLAILERDGIVRQHGTVSHDGGGKPAYVYELTPEAEEDLFTKAYRPVLLQLLETISERLGTDETETLLRETGRRIARERTVPTDGRHARLETAVAVLNELGGFVELEERNGTSIIRGYSCLLTAMVPGHPEVCRLVEALLTELAGAPVHERCDRGERPRCCFEVATVGDTTRR
jgi:predicted ArsR family transcriptional regulator